MEEVRQLVECEKCSGTGVIKKKDCPACSGKGYTKVVREGHVHIKRKS